ncbi:MAG: PAS domain-containing protein [Desulfofustis sp.]|nr:PAS domain-containing protein [Desulfofustis sp.]
MVIKQKKLFWQILLVHLAILLLTIFVVSWFSFRTFNNFYLAEKGIDLENRAYLIKSSVVELLRADDQSNLRKLVVDAGRSSGTRITIIEPDGLVIADTNENPEEMDNHRTRPEIDTAFAGVSGTSLRFSNTLGQRMLYTAIPLYAGDAHGNEGGDKEVVISVLRMSVPLTTIDGALADIRARILTGALLAVAGALLLTFLVSRSISRPLEEMTKGAEQYARGDFSRRMLHSTKAMASKEIASLATAMDQMADQLDETISTIVNQRNQLETVFSSMVEALIAVDREERIISINDATAQLFGIERQAAQGRLVQEAIRNTELHQQIERILSTGRGFEDEIVLEDNGSGNTYLHTNVVPLHGGNTEMLGALIVLNDVTRLRMLETMRSEFVANVSHELRTPITSIRGYVETLLDGALDEREDAEKFLEIVLRQSEQLEEIIDDLLALSRIEREANDAQIDLEQIPLKSILEEAADRCRPKAEESDVAIVIDCPENLELEVNPTLLEQAVVNLLHNGITYSEAGQEVVLTAGMLETVGTPKVRISVEDNGIGIAKEHLPRLFERFYRSDRARSRKEGGTGLGLAIVKHIVQAHGGSVEVESTVGKGSTFHIILDS